MHGPSTPRRYRIAGFTFIEMMIVFTVAGILLSIMVRAAASVVRSANVLKIMVDSSGTPVQLGTQLDFSQRYGATLGASPRDTIQFDPRGFVVNVTQTPKLIVAFGGRTDTVCVTGLGKITARSCP